LTISTSSNINNKIKLLAVSATVSNLETKRWK